MQIFRSILFLAMLAFTSGTAAALDAGNLRAELEDMERRGRVEPAAVLKELKEALPLLESAERYTRMWYFLRRAQVHNTLFMYDEFENDIQQLVALDDGNAPLQVQLWMGTYQGLIQTRHGKLQKGIQTLTRTALRARQNGDHRVYVYTIAELAYTRGLLEQYDESLLDLQQAYSAAIEMHERDLIGVIHDAYGAVYGYMLDYPRALEYYNLALHELEQVGYKEQIASVVLGLASTYRYAGDLNNAEHWYNRYIDATAYATGNHQMFYGQYGLAMTFAEQSNCDRALPQLSKALAMPGPDDYKAELLKHVARCEAAAGNFVEAQTALDNASEILNAMPELEGTTWLLDLKLVESKLEYYRGNTARAYDLLDEYRIENDRLIRKTSSESMNMLRAELEHDRKDMEISLLEGQAELHQLHAGTQTRENTLQRYLIILSVAISLVILAALFAQRRNNRRILALSHRDGLSGLYNRRYTFNYLERVIAQSAVADSGLSIILMDIDDFKQVNDKYGHPTGDSVIKHISELGERSLRNRDIIGRIGGEEFLCVLPRTSVEQSLQVAQRLLDAISCEVFTCDDGTRFSITMSMGVAHNNEDISNAEELYALADKAMYQSKNAGKGRITILPAG